MLEKQDDLRVSAHSASADNFDNNTDNNTDNFETMLIMSHHHSGS